MKNPFEILQFLDKSNCRQCLLPSCMAFAVAIFQGQKILRDCPHLSKEVIESLSTNLEKRKTLEDDHEKVIIELKKKVTALDLSSRAKQLGLPFIDGEIGINCLGKNFWIDAKGEMTSECHNNHWIYIPLLHYTLFSKGVKPQMKWVNFSALKGSTKAWSQYFSHRCETGLQQLADAHKDLLFEILEVFCAKQETSTTNADHCFALEPLPNILVMINYWLPEDDFDSQLTLLFDKTTPSNIDLDSLYLICRGLIEMFRELIAKHSKDGKLF